MPESNKAERPSRAEEQPEPRATLRDLSRPAIERYLGKIGERHSIPSKRLWEDFRRRGFLVLRDKRWVPTKLGILLFAMDPTDFYPE